MKKQKIISEFMNTYDHGNQFVTLEGNRLYLQSSYPTFFKMDVTCVYLLALDVTRHSKITSIP